MTSHDDGDEYGTPDVGIFHFLRAQEVVPVLQAQGGAPLLLVHSVARRGKGSRLRNVGEVH